MSEFFCLHHADSEKLLAQKLRYDDAAPREIIRCEVNQNHWYPGPKLRDWMKNAPLNAGVRHNRYDEMLIWLMAGDACLVSESLAAAMQAQGFTGYSLSPATVTFRDKTVMRSYRQLQLTGWGGQARPESGIRLLEQCSGCPAKSYSALSDPAQLIDPSQWSGEDFFIVWPIVPSAHLFVTPRVAEFFVSLNLRTCVVHPVAGLTGRNRPGKWGFSLRSLAQYMPEDLAEKYGRLLGIV